MSVSPYLNLECSPHTDELVTALAKCQASFPIVRRDLAGPYGPYPSYKSVRQAVSSLSAEGILLLQPVIDYEVGRKAVVTEVRKGAQWMRATSSFSVTGLTLDEIGAVETRTAKDSLIHLLALSVENPEEPAEQDSEQGQISLRDEWEPTATDTERKFFDTAFKAIKNTKGEQRKKFLSRLEDQVNAGKLSERGHKALLQELGEGHVEVDSRGTGRTGTSDSPDNDGQDAVHPDADHSSVDRGTEVSASAT